MVRRIGGPRRVGLLRSLVDGSVNHGDDAWGEGPAEYSCNGQVVDGRTADWAGIDVARRKKPQVLLPSQRYRRRVTGRVALFGTEDVSIALAMTWVVFNAASNTAHNGESC